MNASGYENGRMIPLRLKQNHTYLSKLAISTYHTKTWEYSHRGLTVQLILKTTLNIIAYCQHFRHAAGRIAVVDRQDSEFLLIINAGK